jgi:hypothetical protein
MERKSVNKHVKYLVELRDKYIDREGLWAKIKLPKEENEADFFGDIITTEYEEVAEIRVIPQYKEYEEMLSKKGTLVEGNYPLKVLIKSTANVYRDSLIELPRPPLFETDDRNEQSWSWWRVIGEGLKHLSKNYARFLKCVPARDIEWNPDEDWKNKLAEKFGDNKNNQASDDNIIF